MFKKSTFQSGVELAVISEISVIVARTTIELYSWCYTVQFSLQLVWQRWKKSIASWKRHVTRFILTLQLAMFKKSTFQSGVATCSDFRNLCNRCKNYNRALQLVLHSAIFFATCLATLEKSRLQVGRDMLHVSFLLCNLQCLKKAHSSQELQLAVISEISVIVARTTIELYSWCYTVQFSLQLVWQRWKKVDCKLEETCYTFHSYSATCNV